MFFLYFLLLTAFTISAMDDKSAAKLLDLDHEKKATIYMAMGKLHEAVYIKHQKTVEKKLTANKW